MTTATKQDSRPLAGVLLGAGLTAAVVVLAASLAGLLVEGSSAALGALLGGLVALLVLGLGTALVHVVAGVMPAASLLVALLTYTLQVVLVGAVVATLTRSGLVGETLAGGWFALGLVAATCAWLGGHLWRATHLRLPAYDLPRAEATGRPEAGAR